MIPSEREQELVAMFDSFCKTVIRNYSRTLIRRKSIRPKNLDEPIEVLLDMWGTRDEYPSLSNTFVVDSEIYSIESDTLYKALVSLPEQQRTVLLLDFWDDMTDIEISKKLEVTPRTVYNLRKRAFREIKRFYEHENRGRDP